AEEQDRDGQAEEQGLVCQHPTEDASVTQHEQVEEAHESAEEERYKEQIARATARGSEGFPDASEQNQDDREHDEDDNFLEGEAIEER
ncbi:MAG: hypothetical protein ACNA71_10695, partial [Kiritimatiellia bacterium]